MREGEAPLERIEFVVLGEPSPEGSTRAFYIKKLNRTVTTHQNQKSLEAWRNRVATEAQRALEGTVWTADCVSAYTVDVEFVLSRPPSVAEHRRLHPIVKPDIDKLVRAVNDALTGIMFVDDCQVVAMNVVKDYGDQQRPGAYITVSRYSNQTERPRRGKKKAAPLLPEDMGRCPCDDPRDD